MSAPGRIAVRIEAVGALCAAGSNADQVSATVRAGLSVASQSSVHDRFFSPITMALFPEESLPPLAPALEGLALTSRQRRMLRLAASPLAEVLSGVGGEKAGSAPLPLFLGLPEVRAHPSPIVTASEAYLTHLGAETLGGSPFDLKNSRMFPHGRAAAFLALAAAEDFLRAGKGSLALVGGVDSYLDLAHLAELDSEERLHGERVPHGFVPGEGAAFLLLSASSPRAVPGPSQLPSCVLLGTGLAKDPGHLRSAEPAKGEGLSAALQSLRAKASGPGPAPLTVGRILAGFNGEPFFSKEWGVARLRHADLFAQDALIDHPADCYGELGAATGAMLLALATLRLRDESSPRSILAFASSDLGDCGAAVLARATST